MGGYVVTIAETTNFRWEIHISLSDALPRHWFEVIDKRDDKRWIEMRETGNESSNQSQNDAFDEALDELEKEAQGNHQYAMLTKDQLTLAVLWERMNIAEGESKHWHKRCIAYEEIISSLHSAWNSIETEKTRSKSKGDGNER